MTRYVIDASVAAKWVLPGAGETFTDEARGLLRQYARAQIGLVVPDLFWPELGNIFWKAVRQRRWSKGAADTAIGVLKDRNLPTIPSFDLLEEAFSLATTFDRTVYDGVYVARALRTNAVLVTADEELANALAAHLPVKWLGSL